MDTDTSQATTALPADATLFASCGSLDALRNCARACGIRLPKTLPTRDEVVEIEGGYLERTATGWNLYEDAPERPPRGAEDGPMSATKTLSLAQILTVATGKSVPYASLFDAQDAVSALVGRNSWTHELAKGSPWEQARAELFRQYPAFRDVDGEAYAVRCGQAEDPTAEALAWVDEWAERLQGRKFEIRVVQR
jgi:hypothetical protein